MLCTAARKVGLQSEVCGTEEGKIGEQEGINFEVVPEPTMDELIASIEYAINQISDFIEVLTVKVDKLEASLSKNSKSEGNIAEELLKNPKSAIPVEDAIKIIQNVLPSPMVERSWGFGPQRLCQELRSVIINLRGRLNRNGQPR